MHVTFVGKVTVVMLSILTTNKIGTKRRKLCNVTIVVCFSRQNGKGTITFETLTQRKWQSGRGKSLNTGPENQSHLLKIHACTTSLL